jgi:glycerate 2-kinase
MMRIVLALDKFKGTFEARQACEALAEGIRSRNPKIEVLLRPMADGGEGTTEILCAAMGLHSMEAQVPDLLGKKADCNIYWHNTRRLAVISTSDVLGHGRTIAKPDVLLKSHSIGIGKLISKAFSLRPQEIWICVGGTMTADGGWGLAHALGLRAFDAKGNMLDPSLAHVHLIQKMSLAEVPEHYRKTKIVALCDVNAPARGAAVSLKSFLPQKGATKEQCEEVEKSITTLWSHFRTINPNLSPLEAAFTGAGGGLCLGLQTVFPWLRMELGAKVVAQATALGPSLQSAKLVVCGEGCLDETTFYGKTCSVVSTIAAEHGVKLAGVFGRISPHILNEEPHTKRLGTHEFYILSDTSEHLSISDLTKSSRAKLHEIGSQIAHALDQS